LETAEKLLFIWGKGDQYHGQKKRKKKNRKRKIKELPSQVFPDKKTGSIVQPLVKSSQFKKTGKKDN